MLATFRYFFGVFSVFLTILLKTLFFDAIGRDLGRVLGGAGEGFGRVWEPLGRCWGLPGLLFAVFRYFLLFLVISDCFVILWVVFGCPANFQIFCLSFACFCCCLVLFSACRCCFGYFCFCWSCRPLLEILAPCSCMLQQLSKMFALPVPC